MKTRQASVPVQAIDAIVEYLWHDEEGHFAECCLDENDNDNGDGHIFRDVKKVAAWLQALPEAEAYFAKKRVEVEREMKEVNRKIAETFGAGVNE